MTESEVAVILTMIASVDDRFDPDKARVQAWSAILDEDLPFDFAKAQVISFYADKTNVIMPADLNLPWRKHRADITLRDLSILPSGPKNPMPAHLREELLRTLKTAKKPD